MLTGKKGKSLCIGRVVVFVSGVTLVAATPRTLLSVRALPCKAPRVRSSSINLWSICDLDLLKLNSIFFGYTQAYQLLHFFAFDLIQGRSGLLLALFYFPAFLEVQFLIQILLLLVDRDLLFELHNVFADHSLSLFS